MRRSFGRAAPPAATATFPASARAACARACLAIMAACLLAAAGAGSALAERFVIGSCYSPPLATPAQDGYFDLLLRAAFARLGHEAVLESMPAERSLREADNGHVAGEVGRVLGLEQLYPNLVPVPEPVLERRNFVAFAIRPEVSVNGWAGLAPYRVGLVKGWKICEEGSRGARSVTAVETTRQLFGMLAKDRIDVALSAELDGLAMARELGIRDIRLLHPPLAGETMYLYLNKRHADLAGPLAEALRSLKAEGEAEAIRARVRRAYMEF